MDLTAFQGARRLPERVQKGKGLQGTRLEWLVQEGSFTLGFSGVSVGLGCRRVARRSSFRVAQACTASIRPYNCMDWTDV